MNKWEKFLRKLGFTPYLWNYTLYHIYCSIRGWDKPPIWDGWRCPNIEPHGWHQCTKKAFHLGGCQD